MKLKTISYAESKEILNAVGLKEWKCIGVEAEVEEHEQTMQDWNGVYKAAKQIVEQWHKESVSSAATYFNPNPEALPVIQEKDR